MDSNWVQLTSARNGLPIYVNMAAASVIRSDNGSTEIQFGWRYDTLSVKELPEVVFDRTRGTRDV